MPALAWQVMAQAVKPYRLRFGFAGPEQAQLLARLRAIAAEAWRIEMTTPRMIMEAYKVLRVGAAEIEKNPDGLYVLDPMVVLLNRFGLFDRGKAPAQTIQMWARAGFAPPVGPAPRRGLAAQLVST